MGAPRIAVVVLVFAMVSCSSSHEPKTDHLPTAPFRASIIGCDRNGATGNLVLEIELSATGSLSDYAIDATAETQVMSVTGEYSGGRERTLAWTVETTEAT